MEDIGQIIGGGLTPSRLAMRRPSLRLPHRTCEKKRVTSNHKYECPPLVTVDYKQTEQVLTPDAFRP
jgi:hypothetical protein